MHNRLKISHRSHSGRYRPHEYTSYLPLLLLLVIVGLALGICTAYAASPGPAAGSIGMTGQMPGPPPATAAVITSPVNGQRFGTSPIPIKGTCPKNTLVEIFKNEIFAGSTPCTDSGTFSVEADLLFGQNILIARVYDALNQQGPDSIPVTIFYDGALSQASSFSSFDFSGSQMLLNTDAVYRGVFPDKQLNVPISIIGGTPPYAVNVQWGDSTNKVISRNDNDTFNADHVYRKAGTYQITIQATDAQGRVAFLTVAAIVNGQPSGVAGTTGTSSESGTTSGKLMALWPLYTASVAVVVSFWLGERREKHVLLKQYIVSGPVYK